LEIDRDRDVATGSEEAGDVQHVARGIRDREFIECEPRGSPDESVGSVGASMLFRARARPRLSGQCWRSVATRIAPCPLLMPR
jgi:hypothetical protein